MTYAAPSRLPLAVLWLLLAALVGGLTYINGLVAVRVLELGWQGALESRRGFILPFIPLLTLICLPFMARSAAHFAAYGRQVVVVQNGKLLRAGFGPIDLADITDVSIQELRGRLPVMVRTRPGRTCFANVWLAGPDADEVAIGIRRAVTAHQSSRASP